MLEGYHKMVQKDRHLAIAQGWLEEAAKEPEKPWQIHVHTAPPPPSDGDEADDDERDDDDAEAG
jgi:hypothetical protein